MKNFKKSYQKYLLFLLLAGTSQSGFSQESGLGVGSLVGIGQATMNAPGLGTVNPKVAFMIGGTTLYKFNPLFGIGLDVVGTSKGGSVNGSVQGGFPSQTYNFKETYTMVDVEVPLMAKLFLGSDKFSFNAIAGAGMNFNIYAASTRVYDNANYNTDNGYEGKKLNNINPTNLNYTLGLGITARAGEKYYFVHVRRHGALNAFGTLGGQDARHGSYNLTLGYFFY